MASVRCVQQLPHNAFSVKRISDKRDHLRIPFPSRKWSGTLINQASLHSSHPHEPEASLIFNTKGQRPQDAALEACDRVSVHFLAPLGIRRDLPLMLYLPGMDATGVFIDSQLRELEQHFDVRCMAIPRAAANTVDSSFESLAEKAAQLIVFEKREREATSTCDERTHEVLVVAESFGAPVAMELASKFSTLVDKMVLVNSASGIRKQPWLQLGAQLVTALPPIPASMHSLVAVTFPPYLLSQWSALSEANQNLISPPFCLHVLSQQLVSHRLQMMASWQPSAQLLAQVTASTLIVASGDDRLLPSVKEAMDLSESIPGSQLHILPMSGHVPLLESAVSLEAILQQAAMLPSQSDQTAPPTQTWQQGSDRGVEALSQFVYASTGLTAPLSQRGMQGGGLGMAPSSVDNGGYTQSVAGKDLAGDDAGRAASWGDDDISLAQQRMLEDWPQYRAWNWLARPEFIGLENVPHSSEGPLLFVGNHTLFGIYDMPLMIYELQKQRGITLRGLAHPLHWNSFVGELFAKYGAVKATPLNCYRLLARGESVLLYPGGGSEVSKLKGQKYQLLWKDDIDFVRMAAKFQATIVPFAALGVEDAFDIILDTKEIMSSPLGSFLEPILALTGLQELPFPLTTGAGLVPRPERLYFSFGNPIETKHLKGSSLKDKALCTQLYKEVKESVEAGIQSLKDRRSSDPLQDVIPRMLVNILQGWNGL